MSKSTKGLSARTVSPAFVRMTLIVAAVALLALFCARRLLGARRRGSRRARPSRCRKIPTTPRAALRASATSRRLRPRRFQASPSRKTISPRTTSPWSTSGRPPAVSASTRCPRSKPSRSRFPKTSGSSPSASTPRSTPTRPEASSRRKASPIPCSSTTPGSARSSSSKVSGTPTTIFVDSTGALVGDVQQGVPARGGEDAVAAAYRKLIDEHLAELS